VIRQLLPVAREPLGEEELEQSYFRPSGRHVRANFVTTLDGAVEVGGRSGPLGAPADREVFVALRCVSDVVLVGSGTALAERYGPVLLSEERRHRRRRRGQAARPPVAVVSDSARIDPSARVFTEPADGDAARPLVITSASAAADRRRALASVADVIVAGDTEVDLDAALGALAERGLARVLCEGGPTIFGRLVAAGLLDELCLTLSGTLAGAGHLGLAGAVPHPAVALELHELYEGDGLLMAAYRRKLP